MRVATTRAGRKSQKNQTPKVYKASKGYLLICYVNEVDKEGTGWLGKGRGAREELGGGFSRVRKLPGAPHPTTVKSTRYVLSRDERREWRRFAPRVAHLPNEITSFSNLPEKLLPSPFLAGHA